MPPLPKKKTPASRQGQRRSQIKLTPSALSECTQCHTMKPQYVACPKCGTYDGRQVMDIESKAPKNKKGG